MKAQEYYEKYFENTKSFEEIAKNGNSMFQDMLKEIDEIKKQRKVKTFDGKAQNFTALGLAITIGTIKRKKGE